MTSADLALYVGQIVAAWCLGFAGSYTITKWRDAMRSTL